MTNNNFLDLECFLWDFNVTMQNQQHLTVMFYSSLLCWGRHFSSSLPFLCIISSPFRGPSLWWPIHLAKGCMQLHLKEANSILGLSGEVCSITTVGINHASTSCNLREKRPRPQLRFQLRYKTYSLATQQMLRSFIVMKNEWFQLTGSAILQIWDMWKLNVSLSL